MGHHYVPQRYLLNFQATERTGFIWLHDKRGDVPKLAKIAQVAQTRAFYSAETEALLGREVETPANQVIDRLLRKESIGSGERLQLAYYIATMLKRVPYRRRKAKELIPGVLEKTVREMRRQIQSFGEARGTDPIRVQSWLEKVEVARQKFATNPPAEVLEQIREPWPSERMVEAIFTMGWRILISSGPQYFIISDNPAFFFSAYGLGTEKAELSFPLSTTHCLHGSRQPVDGGLMFGIVRQIVVREMNRRLASTVERLAFYHEPGKWLQKILAKENPYLSVIRW